MESIDRQKVQNGWRMVVDSERAQTIREACETIHWSEDLDCWIWDWKGRKKNNIKTP